MNESRFHLQNWTMIRFDWEYKREKGIKLSQDKTFESISPWRYLILPSKVYEEVFQVKKMHQVRNWQDGIWTKWRKDVWDLKKKKQQRNETFNLNNGGSVPFCRRWNVRAGCWYLMPFHGSFQLIVWTFHCIKHICLTTVVISLVELSSFPRQ